MTDEQKFYVDQSTMSAIPLTRKQELMSRFVVAMLSSDSKMILSSIISKANKLSDEILDDD